LRLIRPLTRGGQLGGIAYYAVGEAYFVYARVEVDDACGLTESLLSAELNPDTESKLIRVHEEPGPRQRLYPSIQKG
jgi:hypothetical protein